MKLRALVFLQIACIVFLGAAIREGPNAVFSGRWDEAAKRLAVIIYLPVWIGIPILVCRALNRSGLPAWKRWIIAGIEAALVYATMLAMLPAVQ
ncbi:hypothetical protein [Paludisphaera borealis]|uniref:Uncharacterized protein n=1 Tax=Paludisphaera borealis TaxID=1387353 RepID=A0A1U7CK83_9BACT|nr:hypothetical protein [Paludisphaera borealis]APW59350.1 hypothetical protein BSF38_00772 [Paludisphaera borealis]